MHSHGREPHVAAPVGARAGVGQPVHRGSEEEQPEALKELHGGVAMMRGREGRRKRPRRRLVRVFGRGTSASPTAEMLLSTTSA